MRVLVALALLLSLPVTARAHPAPKKIAVAEGVFLFVTPPYGDVGLDGNSVVVLSPDGVLVFDSNGTPAAADAVLAEIRKMTDQPVRYLVHSHWHWDHWYGAEVYQKAYPDLRIVAHRRTRELMMGPALDFNRPGLERDLPGYVAALEKQVAAAAATAPDLPRTKARLEEARFFLDQKRSVHHVFPNLTFTDAMDVHLGGREIQVLHGDRAVTPGDTFLYLPKERVLITGDLLVNPISFALSCYPTGWLHTLERLDVLPTTVLVPGHGEPLHDKALLHATMDVFRELLREGKDAKGRGLDPDQAKAEILPRLAALRTRITGDDPRGNEQFEVYLVDWYLHRVYDELDGRLTDAIAAIPPA